jgi:hypothetical protein
MPGDAQSIQLKHSLFRFGYYPEHVRRLATAIRFPNEAIYRGATNCKMRRICPFARPYGITVCWRGTTSKMN